MGASLGSIQARLVCPRAAALIEHGWIGRTPFFH